MTGKHLEIGSTKMYKPKKKKKKRMDFSLHLTQILSTEIYSTDFFKGW